MLVNERSGGLEEPCSRAQPRPWCCSGGYVFLAETTWKAVQGHRGLWCLRRGAAGGRPSRRAGVQASVL